MGHRVSLGKEKDIVPQLRDKGMGGGVILCPPQPHLPRKVQETLPLSPAGALGALEINCGPAVSISGQG